MDESYSAEGDKEEQPSFDQAIPPKVRQYACQAYDADQVQTDLVIQSKSLVRVVHQCIGSMLMSSKSRWADYSRMEDWRRY